MTVVQARKDNEMSDKALCPVDLEEPAEDQWERDEELACEVALSYGRRFYARERAGGGDLVRMYGQGPVRGDSNAR